MLDRFFRPVSVNLSFENRPYMLGEMINLTVQLTPKRDLEVREARVDLVCEERYTETYTVMVHDRRALKGSMGVSFRGGFVPPPTTPPPKIPKRITEKRKLSDVHGGVAFLSDTQLQAGRTGTFNARLKIDPEPPSSTGKGSLTWKLVTTIELPRARDVTKEEKVRVVMHNAQASGPGQDL